MPKSAPALKFATATDMLVVCTTAAPHGDSAAASYDRVAVRVEEFEVLHSSETGSDVTFAQRVLKSAAPDHEISSRAHHSPDSAVLHGRWQRGCQENCDIMSRVRWGLGGPGVHCTLYT